MSKKSLAQPVTTENAGINTVSVTIRALHVNNKQMTLAVFRQLPKRNPYVPEEGWIHPDYNVWGWVNYQGRHAVFTDSEENDGVLYKWDIDKYWVRLPPHNFQCNMFDSSASRYLSEELTRFRDALWGTRRRFFSCYNQVFIAV